MSTKDIPQTKVHPQEVEVEEVEGLIKTPKRVSIKYFDMTREAGGVVLGYRFDTQFQIVRFAQVKSSSKLRDKYRLPWVFGLAWGLFKNASFGEILKGLTIIGEWHTDWYNNPGFSRQDMVTIMRRARMFGYWVGAVVVMKHRNIAKTIPKLFRYNNKTIFRRMPKGIDCLKR